MTRLRLLAALTIAFLPLSDLLAQAETTLPDGAIRRFGTAKVEAAPAEPQFARRPRRDPGPDQAALVPTPDGKQLVVADRTGRIDLFDIATGKLARRIQEPKDENAIHSLGISTDGKWLACGRTKPDVQLWDLAAGKVVATIPFGVPAADENRSPVERLVFSPDSKTLYTGADPYSSGINSGATAWAVPSGKKLWNVTGVGYNLNADPRGRWVVTSILAEDPVRLVLLDPASGRVIRGMVVEAGGELDSDGGRSDGISSTLDRQFTRDGSRLVSSHGDGTTRVWDPLTGKELTRIKWGRDGSSTPGGLACSPDGKWLAIRENRTIGIYEATSGLRVFGTTGMDAPPREFVFTRDGLGLISSADAAPILWTLKPKELPKLDGPPDALWTALGSEDAGKAYRLQWAMAGDAKAAVGLVTGRVKLADLVVDRAVFDRCVASMDSPRFAVRERAEEELTRAGSAVPAAWLRKALAEKGSGEVQARLGRVLAKREKAGPAEWRLERAVQVLEMIGTPEAKAVLKEWAGGPADASLSELAGGALKRLAAGP